MGKQLKNKQQQPLNSKKKKKTQAELMMDAYEEDFDQDSLVHSADEDDEYYENDDDGIEDEQDMEEEDGQDDDDEKDVLDDEEEEEDDDGNNVRAWGSKKNQFYQESDEEEDSEKEEAEEAEVKLMQQMIATQLDDGQDYFDAEIKEITANEQGNQELEDQETRAQQLIQKYAKLNDQQRLEVVKKEQPEILNLLNEYRKSVQELQIKFAPLSKRVNNKQNQVDQDVKVYVNTRQQLLQSYCLNILFYMALKVQNCFQKDHPVINKIVQIKLLLDKMKGYDAKYAKSIKFLQSDVLSGNEKANKIIIEEISQKEDILNKLEKSQTNKKTQSVQLKGIKVNTSNQNNRENQNKKEDEKNRKKMLLQMQGQKVEKQKKEKRTNYLQELEDESEQKRFSGNGGSLFEKYKENSSMSDSKKLGFDEEGEFDDDNDDEDDFSDLGSLLSEEYQAVPKKNKKDQKQKQQDGKQIENKNMDLEGEGDDDDDDDDGEDEFYKAIKQKKLQKKKKKQSAKKALTDKKFEEMKLHEVEEEDDARKVNYMISKNKGLIRKRPKENRNSRVKHRRKYEDAQIKLKSQGKFVRERQNVYGGEATGIKAGLIRGVKLRQSN